MSKKEDRFVCQSCGAVYRKWVGRCESCGEWNSVVEEAPLAAPGGRMRRGKGKGKTIEFADFAAGDTPPARLATNIAEFDRTCGGGLVPGSAVLIGGDPGIGKSTLLLQIAAALSKAGNECVYISGEESVDQIRMRADRLGAGEIPAKLAAATDLRDILTSLSAATHPDFLVIDSIQTLFLDSVESAPGSVAQVRACAHELISYAKRTGAVIVLVGHVTKDGQIAGPRVLEHMVDTVLYFEGDPSQQFRILRAVKNRYGGTDEIGVFEMSGDGLVQIENPSELFLSERDSPVSGTAVFAGLEGTRPVLVEIQALVAESPMATPRRAVVGWDSGRLAMILAVLDARCRIGLAGREVYLNVAGGLRINEPAADLAVAAALLSALNDIPVPEKSIFFGEISLSGDVRPVAQADQRLREAAKLGFTSAYIPARSKPGKTDMAINIVDHVHSLVDIFAKQR